MGYESPEIAAPPRITRRPACLFYLVVGLVAGVVLDRAMIAPRASETAAILTTAPEIAILTRENYARIEPGMTSWEVGDILGPGIPARERGVIVRPDGTQEEFEREEGRSSRRTGPAPKGARTRVERVLLWREGPRSVRVGFLDDKVESKSCDGLF